MNITLKVKHFKFLAYVLKNIVSNDSFHILNQIKNNVNIEDDDTNDATITVVPANLIFVYPILSNMKEGEVATINDEMDTMLLPQMQAGVNNNDSEWIELATFITQHKANYQNTLSSYIQQGYEFLTQQ